MDTISSNDMNGSTSDQKKPSSAIQQMAALKAAASFGQIVSLMMRSPNHRFDFIADLEWMVGPAVALNQFAIGEMQDKASGQRLPAAVALWALVSEDVDRRLSTNPNAKPRLKPAEWRSGSIPWLIEVAGDQHAVAALLRSLVETRFRDTGLRMVTAGPDQKPTPGILKASGEKSQAAAATSAG